jgi:hypothetical protein
MASFLLFLDRSPVAKFILLKRRHFFSVGTECVRAGVWTELGCRLRNSKRKELSARSPRMYVYNRKIGAMHRTAVWIHTAMKTSGAGGCSLYVLARPRFYFSIMIVISAIMRPRWKLPRRSAELRAHFHWLAPPFCIRRLQIKAPHGVSLRKSMVMLFPFYAFSIYAAIRRNITPPRITRVTCETKPS